MSFWYTFDKTWRELLLWQLDWLRGWLNQMIESTTDQQSGINLVTAQEMPAYQTAFSCQKQKSQVNLWIKMAIVPGTNEH